MKINEKIKMRREMLGYSQPKLAELCGWFASASTRISNYENGTRLPRLPEVIKIAKALKIDPGVLAFDESPSFLDAPIPEIKGIPCLSWQDAIAWPNNKDKILDENFNEYVGSAIHLDINTYALKIHNDSMIGARKAFYPGSFIIIDPSKQYKKDDYVVAKIKDSDELIFRIYEKEGASEWLKALSEKIPHMKITKSVEIVGVVVAHLDILV